MTGLALHPTANVWAEDQNNEIKADGVVEVHIYDIACSKNIAMSFLFLFFIREHNPVCLDPPLCMASTTGVRVVT